MCCHNYRQMTCFGSGVVVVSRAQVLIWDGFGLKYEVILKFCGMAQDALLGHGSSIAGFRGQWRHFSSTQAFCKVLKPRGLSNISTNLLKFCLNTSCFIIADGYDRQEQLNKVDTCESLAVCLLLIKFLADFLVFHLHYICGSSRKLLQCHCSKDELVAKVVKWTNKSNLELKR